MPIAQPLGLHYTDVGDGPPVILLHGYALTHELWAEQAPLADEFRLLAYDARGCGDSPAPSTGYDFPDLTAELLAFMDALGLRKAHLVGHSRAGGILLRMAFDHPERVASLVFVSSILRGFPWSEDFLQVMRTGREVARAEGVRAAVDRVWLPSPIFAWERERRPDVLSRVEAMTHRWSGAEWLDPATYPAQEVPDIERLSEVSLPTYVLSGQEEMHDFVEIANMLTYWIPGARQKSLQRVGHVGMLENPHETNLYLRAFLRSVARTPPPHFPL